MKKNLFVTALLLAGFSGYGFAQKDDAFFGAKLGLNLSNCTNSGTDPRTGVYVGVMGQYFVTNHFAVEGNLLYSQQGCREEINNVDITVKLDYLNIPILAKYYLADGFNMYLGPQIGFAVKKSTKGERHDMTVEADLEHINTFDFSGVVGVGYDFKFGLFVDFRYSPGFTHLIKDVDSDENARNSVFSFGIGYKL